MLTFTFFSFSFFFLFWTGLHFIGRNFSVAMDEQFTSPIGFNFTFPGLLSLGIDMGLEFPVRQIDVCGILHRREMELKRFVTDLSWHEKPSSISLVFACQGELLSYEQIYPSFSLFFLFLKNKGICINLSDNHSLLERSACDGCSH